MGQSRAFSAPGKALLVGGYLVLEPQYKSYVVALSARMHAVVSTADLLEQDKTFITVSSSQFNNDHWSYVLERKNGSQPIEKEGKKNPFIEMVLVNVFSYFEPSLPLEIHIEIFSDAGYHSQSGSVMKKNSFKAFAYHAHSITEVPKTGLGSSAGLVTVLTTALASVFKPSLDVNCDEDLKMIHNLSQVAHCQAQGKVGSGFDVAAATFGSIIYQRFAPELISNLPDQISYCDKIYQIKLRFLVDNTDWRITSDRVRLPDKFRLIMGDVNSGSETTKLVARVKSWYKSHLPHSLHVYEDINASNAKFIEGLSVLNKLSATAPAYYNEILDSLNEGKQTEVDKFPELANIRNAVNQIRKDFRLITRESQADIEPPVQTALLDECMKLKGVLTGVIPGAGGYDAICLITTDEADLLSQTENKEEFDVVNWLDLKQADVGVVEENPLHYKNIQN